MATTEDPLAAIRDDVGRAIGFVVGGLLQVSRDGQTPTPADLHQVLEHYRTRFQAFTPGVEAIILAVSDGLKFAVAENVRDAKL